MLEQTNLATQFQVVLSWLSCLYNGIKDKYALIWGTYEEKSSSSLFLRMAISMWSGYVVTFRSTVL